MTLTYTYELALLGLSGNTEFEVSDFALNLRFRKAGTYITHIFSSVTLSKFNYVKILRILWSKAYTKNE